MTKRVWITEYVGLSTRLEALAVAFLIRKRWGHEICLDWHELDAFTVEGTRRKPRGLLARLRSMGDKHALGVSRQRHDRPYLTM